MLLNSSEWPKPKNNLNQGGEGVPEERTVSCVTRETQNDLSILNRYFYLVKLTRVISYYRRFTKNPSKQRKMIGPINSFEVEETMILIIKLVQTSSF